jgi:hypothetical protein
LITNRQKASLERQTLLRGFKKYQKEKATGWGEKKEKNHGKNQIK